MDNNKRCEICNCEMQKTFIVYINDNYVNDNKEHLKTLYIQNDNFRTLLSIKYNKKVKEGTRLIICENCYDKAHNIKNG